MRKIKQPTQNEKIETMLFISILVFLIIAVIITLRLCLQTSPY